MLVAGKLGEDTVSRLEDFINDHMKGRKGFNKMLIIEAQPTGVTGAYDGKADTSIHFQQLSDTQQKDALFANYDQTNREKIRSSFRLPPIFVGLTGDYTRATALESREVAEEQVFAPERADHDFIINRLLFPAMGVKYWKYKSLAPKTDNSEIMSGVLSTFAKCGLTIREARDEISRLLNHPLTAVEADWLDLPLNVYLAQLQHGGDKEKVQKSAQDKEDLFLKSLADIEKALN